MSTNKETKILNDSVRYSWAAYHIFVLLSSLIGDSLILYASFQKNSFKLNKFIVAIIQHIAVCDLAYALISVLPCALSLVANSWILGEFMCFARVYLAYFIYPTSMYLVALLTTSKFLFLKYPTRCSNWTKKSAHKLCSLVTILPSIFPLFCLITKWDDVEFNYATYTCDYMYSADTSKKFRHLLTALNLFIPNIIIVATTIPTLMYLAAARKSAKRVRGSVPWQGALTVALTAIIACLSNFPTIIRDILETLNAENVSTNFVRSSKFLLNINIMANFFIYTLTVRSFRTFLKAKFFDALHVIFRSIG